MIPRRSLAVEKTWAVACFLTALALSPSLLVSSLNGGLGVIRRSGEILLVQGRTVRSINPTLGLIAWWAQRAGVLLFVVSMVLGLAVFVRNATIRPAEVFANDPAARHTYPWLMTVAALVVAVPLAIEFGQVVWLALHRMAS